jgi:hypothetical protein
MSAGTSAGTLKGELVRSFFLFKSFPYAMLKRHWGRGLGMPDGPGGKAYYLARLIAAQTILGGLALGIQDILAGRDPRNLNPFEGEHGARNLVSAFLKGGALGLYGDFLFSETSAAGRSPLASMAGPVASKAEGLLALTQGNAVQAMLGKETNIGREMVREVQGLTPGLTMWYTRAAFDRLIFNELVEYFSPGYLSQQQARQFRERGTTYWMGPTQGFDDARAPRINKAIGASQ